MLLPNAFKLIIIIITITAIKTVSLEAQEESPFKINKLNLIWTKAQHSFGPGKLKDLRNDLTKHEFDELTLKKMKAHNQDKDGLFEAAVRKKLLSTMSKYSLERYYDDIYQPIETEHDRKKDNLKAVTEKPKNKDVKTDSHLKITFKDKRLDKLWKKAEQSSFTQEQLMLLHEEFQHQQDKLDEHYEALNMIEEGLDRKMREGDKWENSIESTIGESDKKKLIKESKMKETPNDKKTRLDVNVQQSLNEKYSYIKRDIDKLHKKIISGQIGDDGPFEENAVNNLWKAASDANFTTEELESFKEELEHYQNRIKKLKSYEVQFERNKIRDFKETSPGAEIDPETKHLRKRVKELTHKVDKTHRNLEERIAKKRDEL